MSFFNSISKLFMSSSTVKQGDLLPSEKKLLSTIARINASGRDITSELYQQLRDYEMNWLERHYDFNSIEGINNIPVSKSTPGAPTPGNSFAAGHTGEAYYYLRHKSYCYENAGQMDLALACMRKSVALVKCRTYFSIEDCYPLAKMLARAGYMDEAYQEIAKIEYIFGKQDNVADMLSLEATRGREARDYFWLQVHLPEKCPKALSSYRRMKHQNTKNFQSLKSLATELGREI